ncbi:hypothetical protein VPH184E373B_0287 [Vibrio phage 184E37-3b]|nr:hypothetical protein MYOV056v2_p0249 [Vibrio phage 184E37.3a]QZI90055.1 hypothetical protein MYOV057v1_p0140 [Vibrio phage 184E37.1]
MAEVKRKAGRPKKEVELANKMEAAELKMKELEVVLATRVTAAHEKLVTEFEEHIAFISRVARGEEKGATMSNRIKCAEMMIKRVDELQEALGVEGISKDDLSDEMEKQIEQDKVKGDGKVVSLITY